MYITILISILSLVFAYISDFTKDKRFLMISFFIIFLFLGFRYDFGNDLIGYMRNFISIQNRSLDISIELDVKNEFGSLFHKTVLVLSLMIYFH